MSGLAVLEELKVMGVTGRQVAENVQAEGDNELAEKVQAAVTAVQEAAVALQAAAQQVNEAVSNFGNVINEAIEVDVEEDEGDDE